MFNGVDMEYVNKLTIPEYVGLIKSNTYKDTVMTLREKNKNDYDYKKYRHKNLPLFYFDGDVRYDIITNRNRGQTLKNIFNDYNIPINRHIGERWVFGDKNNNLLTLDIDNVIDMEKTFNDIKKENCVHICHKTSSGKGFRVLIKLKNKNNELTVKRLFNKIVDNHLDKGVEDKTLFYSSWDEDIYYNKNSEEL
jgi:hypothetical protein